MKPFKAGIVGLGKVAHLHAKAVNEIENAVLEGVSSRSEAKAATFGAAYGAKPYTDIQKMIRELELDLVIICTPHPNHIEPTIQALKAGAHVLVEKPLASFLQDCDAMIEVAQRTGLKLGVISQRRFYPSTIRVKNAVKDGKIGKPVLCVVQMYGWRDEIYYNADKWRGTWEMEGGGVLVNQAPHQLDLMCWLMGPIDEIYGVTGNFNHPYIEVEDTAVAVVKFRSGALGNIILSNSQKPGLYGKIHIHGENGASVGVQSEGGAMFIAGMTGISEPAVNDIWTIPGEEHLREKWILNDTALFNLVDPTVYFIRLQIEEFVDAILHNREPLSNGMDGRRTVELFTAIYRSNRDHKPVTFPLESEYGRNDFDGRISK